MSRTCLILIFSLCIPVPVFAQAAWVTGVSPSHNETAAAPDANALVTCTHTMAQPAAGAFRLYTPRRGWLAGTLDAGGNIVSFDPATNFLPGEEIEAIATNNILSITGNVLDKHVWRFRAAASAPSNVMFNSDTYQYQTTGGDEQAVACADFDGDGDMDIAVGRHNGQSHVYFNDGSGGYATAVTLGGTNDFTYDLAVGDFDEDGDMDIVKTNYGGQNVVWLNDGSGNFNSAVNLGGATSETYCLAVGDLNGDGHLDIVCGNGNTGGVPNTIHLGNGTGGFPVTKVVEEILTYGTPVSDCTFDMELADMDNDGKLDIVTAEFALMGSTPCRVYYNDGFAGFSRLLFTGTALVANSSDLGGMLQAMAVAVGDIDNDGDNDVIIGTNGNPGTATPVVGELTHMFINNGNRTYNMTYMSFQDEKTWCIRMADFNADGYLDCMFANEGGYRTVRLNDGTGQFLNWLYLGGSPYFYKCDVADMDADGDLDVVSPQWIYHNGPKPPQFSVKVGGNWLSDGDTVQVPHATTLASLAPQILVNDNQGYTVSLATNITNVSGQGFDTAEWTVSAGATPYSVYPTSGVFSAGGITHDFTMQATSVAGAVSTFVFHVAVDYPQIPVMEVIGSGGVPISHNSPATGSRDFGPVDVNAGTNPSIDVTVENNGWADLTCAISIAGPDAGEFILNLGAFASPVSSAGSTTFSISFDPQTASAKTATIQITHNDPALPNPFSFEIKGLGTGQPGMVVTEGANPLAPGAALNWGSVATGAAVGRTITIQNNGTGVLTLGTPALTGPDASMFSLSLSAFNGTVAAGASTSFTLSYSPTAEGAHSATVSFTHDSGTVATPFTLGLSGTAAGPGSPGSGGGSAGSGGGCAGVSGGGAGILLLLMLIAAGLVRRRVCRA